MDTLYVIDIAFVIIAALCGWELRAWIGGRDLKSLLSRLEKQQETLLANHKSVVQGILTSSLAKRPDQIVLDPLDTSEMEAERARKLKALKEHVSLPEEARW